MEGAPGSGALITASLAIAQGRELFALPGKVDEDNSEGPNELIQSGAHMVMHAEDVLNFYDFLYHDVTDYKGLSRAKKQVHEPSRMLKKYGVVSYALRIGSKAAAPMEKASVSVNPKRAPKKKAEGTSAASVKTQEPTPTSPDRSQEILVSLDDTTRKVLEAMPLDRSVSPDALVATGLDMGDVMTSLTMLELGGFVSSLPGGLYTRK